MQYIGEKAIKKLISLIKGDLATKQDSITATGVLERDTTGVINGVETVGATLVETQEATLVDVPNGLLKGDGTTISQAVAGTDYVNSSQAIRYDAAQTLTDAQKTQARVNIAAATGGFGFGGEPIETVSATSKDETYESFCARLDEVMSEMLSNSVKLMHIYPPQIYGKVSTPCSIVYQNADGYCGVYNLGMPDTTCSQWRMIKYNSVWQPFEWVNPPMKLGEEYRTTERYQGKPVYVKAVGCGAMPASTKKNVAHGIENISAIISCTGYFTYGNNLISLPYARGTVTYVGSIWATETDIVVWADNSDYTNYNAFGIIKCTKTTD